MIDGKNYKFLVMRNPHGSDKVPVYDYSTIPPKASNGIVTDAQGVFKMELSHFMSNMDTITINGKELSREEKETYDKMKLSYIRQNVMSEYDRVFTEVDKNLEEKQKNAEEPGKDGKNTKEDPKNELKK